MIKGETIVALSSGAPPAAVAIVRTSGPAVFDALTAVAGRITAARHATLLTLRDPATGDPVDDALVLSFPAPHSATGEDIVEYQCHGGRAVVQRLLDVLAAQPGFRRAEPGEFTRRALLNGRIDLTEAEGLADLLEAETEIQRRAALQMAEGGLRKKVDDWRERIVDLSAQAEAAIDYVDDEDETGIDAARLANQASAIADEIDSILASPRAEPLKEGIRVVLGGPPNAGKSSLLNALVESDRAIVTDIPGTTRDSIDVPVTMGGIPFVLVDTAGLRDSNDVIEQIGIARAERELLSADILLWLGEGAEMPAHPSLVRIRTKIDLKPKLHQSDSALQLSSVTGEGIDLLWKTIVDLAGEYLPSPTQMALNRRQRDALAVVATALRITKETDIVLAAHGLRTANDALDRLTGRAGIDAMLDALFGRFCLGK
ncbi:MAG: tRNA uridine-5-carboxymethylaminomethyl(34) synthesis GTPase MnmE [Sphingomicrobium sp.]